MEQLDRPETTPDVDITDAAREQVGQVADAAKDKASQVADVTKDKAAQVADAAKDKTRQASQWLEENEPKDLVDAVSGFARSKPLAFVAVAVAAGLVVGRLTRMILSGGSGEDE